MMAIELFDIDRREQITDECPACGGSEFVDVLSGDPCPECAGNPYEVLERNLAPLHSAEIELTITRITLRLKELQVEADVLTKHAEAMAQRAKARKNTIERLKQWLMLEMEAAGVNKVKGPFGTAWLQVSPPSIVVEHEELVPRSMKLATITKPYSECTPEDMEFVKSIDVMKSWIHDHLKDTGELVQGVAYVDDRVHLRIR